MGGLKRRVRRQTSAPQLTHSDSEKPSTSKIGLRVDTNVANEYSDFSKSKFVAANHTKSKHNKKRDKTENRERRTSSLPRHSPEHRSNRTLRGYATAEIWPISSTSRNSSPRKRVPSMDTEDDEDKFSSYYYYDDTDEEDAQPIRFMDLLKTDLGIDAVDNSGEALLNAKDDMFNFIRVPLHLEQLLFHGFFMCLDSLLFMVTYLPIRIVRAVCLLFYTALLPKHVRERSRLLNVRFHRTQLYDLLRGSIIVIALLALLQVQMSQIYHFVRGQTFIKLYVMFNMLDIFDRLFCTLGQDLMESLYFVTRVRPHDVLGIFFRFSLGLLYTIAHSYLYFTRIIVLNAAINSTSTALLSMLLSNNFSELKSSVFKRFAEQNLFQVACSDIVERFELFVFIALTALQSSEDWSEFIYGSAMAVCLCEITVDWIKHMFITRFNNLDCKNYNYFREALCRDLAPRASYKDPYPSRVSGKLMDHTQAVAQRVGLATIPLTCVVLRFVWVNIPQRVRENPFRGVHITAVILLFLCLIALKTLLNITLKGSACRYIMSRERSLYRVVSPCGPRTSFEKRQHQKILKEHLERIDKLSSVRRYMLYKSRVPV